VQLQLGLQLGGALGRREAGEVREFRLLQRVCPWRNCFPEDGELVKLELIKQRVEQDKSHGTRHDEAALAGVAAELRASGSQPPPAERLE
jgi:hypothetical protein